MTILKMMVLGPGHLVRDLSFSSENFVGRVSGSKSVCLVSGIFSLSLVTKSVGCVSEIFSLSRVSGIF